MAGNPGGETGSIFDRIVAGWMDLAGRWPKTALAILGLLLALAAIALPRFEIDADSTKMLSADLPAQERAAALNEAFPGLRNAILILVQAPRADAADLAVSALKKRLENRPDWVRSVFAPSVDPFLVGHGFLFRDKAEVDSLFARLSQSANLIAELRTHQTIDGFLSAIDSVTTLSERAGIDPAGLEPLYAEAASVFDGAARGEHRIFGWSSLLEANTGDAAADDRRAGETGIVTRLVTVTPELNLARLNPTRPALDAIDAAIADLPPEIAQSVSIGVTGEPALRAEEVESVFGTIGISAALSLLLVAILLRMALRAAGRSVVAMISLVASLILTAGFAAAVIGTLNLVSIAFIVLMVGLGVDYAIHLLANIAETRRGGEPPTESVYLTGRRIGLALCLSAGTTVLAFLSFSVTDFTGMAQLGVIGAAGTVIALATALTLIPAVVAFRPRTAGTVAPRREPLPAVRRMRALPYIVLALGAAAIWPASHVHFDADPMALRNPDSPSVRAFRTLADSPQTTPYRANVLAGSAEEAAAIAVRFKEVPGVANAVTIADLIPADQEEKLFQLDIAAPSIEHAVLGEPTEFTTRAEGEELSRLREHLAGEPGAAGQLAEALAAYQANRTSESDAALTGDLFASFPMLIDRLEAMLSADEITVDVLPSELRTRYLSPEGIHRIEVLPDHDLDTPAKINEFAETVQQVAPDAAGGPIQFAAAGATIARAVLIATALSAVATSVLALAATRRASDTIAILLPLAIAGLITAAASVLLDMPFNYANVIVLPLMLGLGVDSGVHIAIRERRAPGAVFATATPRAVLFSALTTIAAFGTLALSDHRGTASMGVLLSVALVAAVGSVLGLTPAIIRWRSRF
ncbi:MAG TPA: efflux RND transporter permease subunit [Paracoccaceae bacterium]|nr:efflux RND transporter permease subunit [Paracoccaceae bacterium]